MTGTLSLLRKIYSYIVPFIWPMKLASASEFFSPEYDAVYSFESQPMLPFFDYYYNLKLEVITPSVTSAEFHRSIQRYIPDDITSRNLKSITTYNQISE